MRVILALVTLLPVAATSCRDPRGIEVIVQPGNPAVTSVRVFVGVGGATRASLTTSARVEVDDVAYWARDASNENDVVTGVDGAGEVKFLFNTDAAIPAVIAVGYDTSRAPIAAGSLTDLELRAHGYTGYELPLFGPVAALGTPGAAVQLGLWSPSLATSAYDAACAGVVLAGDAPPTFVVTANDQDCDGLADDDTAHECTPDSYLGTRDADPSEASCLVSDHTPTNVAACKLGGATCTDAVPRDQNTCVAGHTCTLDALCAQCGSSFACAANPTAQLATIDHYECALPRKMDNSPCATTFTLPRPPTGGYGCKELAIGDATSPLGPALTVGAVELDASIQDSATASCAGKLTAKLSGGAMTEFTGLVSFELQNNAGVALPVHVAMGTTTMTSCPAATECALVTPAVMGTEVYQPALTACAAAWGPPAAIATLANNGGSLGVATDPTLSADQLEIIYVANNALYRSTRTAVGAMWATPAPVRLGELMLPTGASLHAPKLSPDGLRLLFILRDVIGAPHAQLTTRSAATVAAWNTPVAVTSADATIAIASIAWGPGTHVMVQSGGGTASDGIYDATLDPTALAVTGFTSVRPAGADPYVTADGMHLYFDARTETAQTSLFVASRRSPTEAFAHEVQLTELGADTSVNTSPWVPAGARTIYYASQRGNPAGSALYSAQRTSY